MAFQPANLAPIYMAAFGDLGDSVAGAVGNYFDQRNRTKAFEAARLPDGSGYDWNKLAMDLIQHDPKTAAVAMRMADMQSGGDDRYKSAGGGTIFDSRTGQITNQAPQRPSPTALKAQFETEDKENRLTSARSNLQQAWDVIGKGVFEGGAAETRAVLAGNYNIGGVFDKLGIEGLDPAKAKRTLEYLQIVGPEAVKTMSDQLAGSTAYQELLVFKNMFANPDIPNELKKNQLKRTMDAIDRDLKTLESRKQQLGAAGAGPGVSGDQWEAGQVYETPMGPKRYLGNDEWEDE